jgi:hypothetical protein
MEESGNILYQELEEINEIFFHQKGLIDIGFEVNRKPHKVLRIHCGTIIGAYNCIYNKKTMCLYQCSTRVEGYMLRKKRLFKMLDLFEEIAEIFKENIKQDYFCNIKFKVTA